MPGRKTTATGDDEPKTNVSHKLTKPPPSLVNVLVCTHCDHPLCGPEDILGTKIDIHPLVGFSYEFEDLLNINTDDCEAPNCYRINVTSTTTLHTGEEQRGSRTRERDGCPTTLVTDSASILEEAIRFVEEINQAALRQQESEVDNNSGPLSDGTRHMFPIILSDNSGGEEEPIESLMGSSGGYMTGTTSNNITNASSPVVPTLGQSISSTSAVLRNLTIPETLTQEQSTRVDILRVKGNVCQYGVSPQIDEFETDEVNSDQNDQGEEYSDMRTFRTITRDDTISPEMEWFPRYKRGERVICAGCGMVLGWKFSLTPSKDDEGTIISDDKQDKIIEGSDTNSEVGTRRHHSQPVDEESFVGLILREVKQREWQVRDISKQCIVARAVARRETLVAMGGGNMPHLLVPQHVRNGPQVLEEDAKAKRQLEELTRNKLSLAVDERVAQYRVQANLLTSLLEKHKEQTSVLMQLLKGQREKLSTLEGKIRTYDEIFIAQRQQLETQQRHIMFQDELMKTLRGQTATSQGQIEEQHRILKEQNSTITKQNIHMKDLQAYVRSMVTTQIRIKSHLEAMTRVTNEQGGISYGDGSEGSFLSPRAAGDSHHDAITSPLHRREEIITATAAKMLAEMAQHESAFDVNYSMPDSTYMPGSAGIGVRDSRVSSPNGNTPSQTGTAGHPI